MAIFLTILMVVVLTIFGAGDLTGTAVARRRFRWEQQRAFSAAEVFGQGYRAGAADAGRADAGRITAADAGHTTGHTTAADAGRADPAQGPPPPDPVMGPSPTGPTTRPTIDPGPPPAAGSEPGPTHAFATSSPPTFPVLPEPTPEERAAHKAARDLRNINIALYSASLLLIAAGGLFIGTAVPGVARAVTICAVVALFYVAGLVTHARLPRLRPASIAFAGTGLALLPLAGLLLGILTGEGRLAWFVTAVIGSVAYVLAAVLLQSRVVAYLALPFFLSIALSSVALLGGALVWYFTCSIAVAALFAVTLRLRPRWLPAVVARAIIDTHRLLAPIALAASLILGARLPEGDRALLWVVAAAYYAALLVILAERRSQHFCAARLIGSITVLFVALASGVSWPWALLILSLAGAVQVIALLAVGIRVSAFLRRAERPAPIPGRGGAGRRLRGSGTDAVRDVPRGRPRNLRCHDRGGRLRRGERSGRSRVGRGAYCPPGLQPGRTRPGAADAPCPRARDGGRGPLPRELRDPARAGNPALGGDVLGVPVAHGTRSRPLPGLPGNPGRACFGRRPGALHARGPRHGGCADTVRGPGAPAASGTRRGPGPGAGRSRPRRLPRRQPGRRGRPGGAG